MKDSRLLTVIIPWNNRYEIEKTLASNNNYFKKNNVELIIVSCGGDFEWLIDNCNSLSLFNTRCIELKNVHFNKSLALNIGAYKASSPLLFFMDADIFFNEEDVIFTGLSQIKKNIFLTIRHVFETNSNEIKLNKGFNGVKEIGYAIELLLGETCKIKVETSRVNCINGSRSAPGLIFLSHKNFIGVNGMNSNLTYWGWEDIDLQVRLQAKLNISGSQIGSVMHFTHGDEVRNLYKNRAESEMKNFALCLMEYDRGNYNGTYKEDIERWKDDLHEVKLG